MVTPPTDENPVRGRRRSLKAVLAGDVANSSGPISVNETHAAGQLLGLLKVAREQIEAHGGWLIGMPGDGVFALFDSAVEAVSCALLIQQRLAERASSAEMLLRIGVHLGDILFEDGLPFGEALTIAARLQALADPGGILVSSAVVDAVSGRISASFEDRGAPRLKNIPRRIATCSVKPLGAAQRTSSPLDDTTPIPRARPAQPLEPHQQGPAAVKAPHAPRATAGTSAAPVESGAKAAAVAATPSAAAAAASAQAESAAQRSSAADTAPAVPARRASAAPAPAARSGKEQPAALPFATRPPIVRKEGSEPPSPEDLARLTSLLAAHVGPLARIIVARRAGGARTLGDLVQAVENEIPNATERQAFREAAARAGLLKR